MEEVWVTALLISASRSPCMKEPPLVVRGAPPRKKNDHQGIREKGHHSNGVTQSVTSHRDICPCKLGGYTLRRRKGGVPEERLEVPATSWGGVGEQRDDRMVQDVG